MGNCIAIVSDLIFATRITGTADKVGAKCEIIKDPGTLQDALESQNPGTVLVDMNCAGLSPEEAIRTVKSHCPNARVVAFFSHVQTELMEQARAAGADDVWPRSAFVQRLPELLASLDRPSRL
jgi:DNA-binding NarL/FixJ family response regulator